MPLSAKEWMPSGLRFRIMLPAIVFVVIFSLFFIVLNNYYTSKILDERLEREAVRISKILRDSPYVLNSVYLKRLGEVIEGRIAVFDASDHILAASFDLDQPQPFLDYVYPETIRARHLDNHHDQAITKIHKNSKSFLLVSRNLFFSEADVDILITILTPMDDLEAIKSQAAFRMILSGALALLIAFAAAGLVLKQISSSLKNILSVTTQIALGDFNCKAELPKIDEFKTLATSINTMSDQLQAYEKKLIHSTHQISADKITAAMAHEIKNPLSSMKMLAQILKKSYEQKKDADAEGIKMLDALIKEINRLNNLVSDLRALSGITRINVSKHLPGQVLEDVVELLKPKLDHLNVCLNVQIETDLPELLIDGERIKQVLWNLMMNGAESMPHGGVLDVTLKKKRSTDQVEFQIKDNGDGIQANDMEQLFTPFFTTKKEGIGIGLHVSREIAMAHHGNIHIFSQKTGTTAILTLPCQHYVEKGTP